MAALQLAANLLANDQEFDRGVDGILNRPGVAVFCRKKTLVIDHLSHPDPGGSRLNGLKGLVLVKFKGIDAHIGRIGGVVIDAVAVMPART